MASPFAETVRMHIRAGYPILYAVTPEEDRAIDLLQQALGEGETALRRRLLLWSVARGLYGTDNKPLDRKTADPTRVLPYILDEIREPAVFVLQDFHFFLDERAPAAPLVIRQLRDLVTPFKSQRKTVVLLSPVLKIPPELEKDLTVLDLPMPDEAELLGVLDDMAAQMSNEPKVEVRLEGDARERIVKALSGLTKSEAENALAKVIVTHSRLDPQDTGLLLSEKEQIIRKSGTLEYYPSPGKFGIVGGLDALKKWLRERGRGFSEAARAFGLPSPRGLLLVGVPGCGKSLTAKAVAAEWNMPLLKFDLGKVFASLVGQAEENIRRATKMAEAVAPCVLWIDEIEKGLAGSRGGTGDSGVAARIFGHLLTWMEENTKQVFTIATSNDIDSLAPELLRRFDEIFFVGLPNPAERANILAIHLARHHRDPREFDLVRHTLATDRFSGAELEQVVVSALYSAFAEGEKTRLEDRHLERAILATRPLSVTMGAKIRILEERAKEWPNASGDPEAPVEPPQPPAKPRRIFEV